MIIMDFSQVSIASVMVQIGNHRNTPIEVDLLRHMVLNTIRFNRKKFKKDYGDLVIACDHGDVWRRDIFPEYKAHRKKFREEDELDWTAIFNGLGIIREELKELFPYPVVHVHRAEADDVIATLVKQNGLDLASESDERILILSGDKDFGQLQHYANVDQYNPVQKKEIVTQNPRKFLFEHILRGDPGDGIPNVLSDDDTFITEGKRQKPLRSEILNDLTHRLDEGQDFPIEIQANLKRNQTLIDLSKIPSDLEAEILSEYNSQQGKDRSKLFNFFVEKKLNKLLDSIGDF